MTLSVINGPIIAAGEAVSEAIDCSGGDLVRITMPAGWTPGAHLTVLVSTDGEGFNDLFDARGNEITLVVTTGAAVPVLDIGGWTRMLGFLKFRSGTRDAPMEQDKQRDFAVTISSIRPACVKTISRYDLGVTHTTSRKYLNPGEQDVLVALVHGAAPKIVVEIGVNDGLTAQAVLRECHTIERYIGVDVDANYVFEIPAQQIERPDEPGQLVKHDPRFRLTLRGDPMPEAADVVFIDGDHGKRAVLADSIWATAVVRRGGLIIWHDYSHAAVEVTGVLNQLDIDRELYHVYGTWLVFEQR